MGKLYSIVIPALRGRRKEVQVEKMLFTNNSRKMLGIPLRRKKDKRKRVYARNRAEEDLEALVDYWDGKWDDIGTKGAAGSSAK